MHFVNVLVSNSMVGNRFLKVLSSGYLLNDSTEDTVFGARNHVTICIAI